LSAAASTTRPGIRGAVSSSVRPAGSRPWWPVLKARIWRGAVADLGGAYPLR
jgi:hypothetical protein